MFSEASFSRSAEPLDGLRQTLPHAVLERREAPGREAEPLESVRLGVQVQGRRHMSGAGALREHIRHVCHIADDITAGRRGVMVGDALYNARGEVPVRRDEAAQFPVVHPEDFDLGLQAGLAALLACRGKPPQVVGIEEARQRQFADVVEQAHGEAVGRHLHLDRLRDHLGLE